MDRSRDLVYVSATMAEANSPFTCYGQQIFAFGSYYGPSLKWAARFDNSVCDSYMGMAIKEDETFMYVFNADPVEQIPRISFFEPGGGKYYTSYFF